MPIATFTSKGQITLPVELRNRLRLAAGDRVELFYQADGAVALRPLKGSVKDLKGIVGKRAKPASIEEMDRAIAAAVSRRDKANRR